MFDLRTKEVGTVYKTAKFSAKGGYDYNYSMYGSPGTSSLPATANARKPMRPKTLFTYEEGAAATCEKPANVETKEVAAKSATLTWAKAEAANWQYICLPAAEAVDWEDAAVKTTTDTFAVVGNLNAETNYKFYVRRFCSAEDQSKEVVVAFTTEKSCFAPTMLGVPDAYITSSSAKVTWSSSSKGETQWQYTYGLYGSTPDWTNAVVTDQQEAALSELTPATLYQVWVRSYCAEDDQSEAATEYFATACGAVELPFSEDFNSTDAGDMPMCWTTAGYEGGVSVASSGYVSFSSKGLYFTGGGNSYAYAILPELGADLNTLQVAFKHIEENASKSGKIELGYYKDATFTSLKAYDVSISWKAESAFALSDIPAGAKLAFGYKAATNLYTAAIDDITISTKPSCLAPADLAASEIAAKAAKLTWSSEASAFKVQYTTDKANWGDEHAVNAKTLELSNLIPATKYYARIKAVCSETESSDYCAEIEFTTECETGNIGWSESFAADTKPACWTIANWGTSANYWTTASEFAKTGYALRYNAKTYNSSDAITPSIYIAAESQLQFYIRNSVGNNSNKVECKVLINDGTETKEVAHITTRYTTATLQTVDLSAYVGKTITIIFRGIGYDSSTTCNLWIDEVSVAYPPVAVPTELKAEAKNASAVITWAEAEGVKWNVRYKTGDAEWTLVEGLTAATTTLTNLANDALYNVEVQAYVDDNRKSDWVATTVTPRACAAVSNVTLSDKTYNSVQVSWEADIAGAKFNIRYKASDENEWTAVAGDIAELTYKLTHLTANKTYTIQVKATCGGDDDWMAASAFTPVYTRPTGLSVSATDAKATATWNAVADADGYKYLLVAKGTEDLDWTKGVAVNETSAEITNLETGKEFDMWVAAVYGDHLEVISFETSFKTSAIAPSSLAVSDITSNSAKLTWENTGAATKYQWALEGDNLQWYTIGDKSVEITELSANTAYTVLVRTWYTEDVQSANASVSFRTECESFSLPFAQDFNELTALPDCWSNVKETNFGKEWTINESGREGKCVAINCNAYNAGYTELATPVIVQDKAAVLKFNFKNTKAAPFHVLAGEAGAAERDTLLKNLTGTAWTEKEVEIPAALVGKNIQIFFSATPNDKDASYIYLDDVTVTEKPACVKPIGLTVVNILFDRAILSWTAAGEETAWQVGYRETNTDAVLTIADATTSKFVLEGVTGKTYEVQVRAYCDEDHQSEWTDAVTFTLAYKAPTSVEVSEVTTNSAMVTWTANSGETAWTLQIRKAGDTYWGSQDVENSAMITLTDLMPGTKFEVRVLAGDAASETVSFTTECAAVAVLPYEEDFNGVDANAVPACWEVKGANGDNQPTLVAGSTLYISNLDGNALILKAKASDEAAYALLPEFAANVLDNAQITFLYAADTDGKGVINFGYFAGEQFTSLKEVEASAALAMIDPFVLPALPAGARLAFSFKVVSSDSYDYYVAVDAIVIEEKPACAVPTELAISEKTAHSAKIAWTSDAEKFAVELKEGEGEWTAVNAIITASPFELTGLKANTAYSVRVKAVCDDEHSSEFAEVAEFTTECDVFEMPFSENFVNGVPACWAADGTWTTNTEFTHSGNSISFDAKGHNGSLTTPAVKISEEDAVLIFYFRNIYGGSNYVSGKVSITDGEATLDSAFVNAKSDNLERREISLAQFNGKTVTITFSFNSAASTAKVYVGDVRVVAKPCGTPAALTVQAANGQATLSWNASEEEETAWQVGYRVADTDIELTIVEANTTTYVLEGLQNNVEYEAQVRAVCGENIYGEWTEAVKFTPSAATAIDNNSVQTVATKRIEDGLLIIECNGKNYNAQGVMVR